ncbi:MAG: AsmA family protein, partial [Pseudomonadota bacterium]
MLLVTALAAALFLLDLGRFKGPALAFASDLVGRRVSMTGDLSVRIGRSVTLRADGLQIASVDWTTTENLLAVDRLVLEVDTLSLLGDEIVVHNVNIAGLNAELEVTEDGSDNFSLPYFEETSDTPPAKVRLVQFTARDIDVSYVTPALPEPLVIALRELDVEQQASDLVLALTGTLNDEALNAGGSVGALDDLLAATNVSFDLDGNLGEVTFDAIGTIDDLTVPRRPRIRANLSGPEARYLTDLIGLDAVTSGPIQIEVEVAPRTEDAVASIAGDFGEFRLRAEAQSADLQHLAEASLSADASGPSLASVGALFGLPDIPVEPFTLAITAALSGERLHVEELRFAAGDTVADLEADLPAFPSPAGGTARLEMGGPEIGHFGRLLGLPGRLIGPFSIEGTLTQRAVEGDLRLTLEAEGLSARLEATISDQTDLTGTVFSAGVEGADLSVLAAALDLEEIPGLPFAVSLEAELEADALAVRRSSIGFGRDEISLTGLLGRDPKSEQTRLRVTGTIPELDATLRDFGLEVPEDLASNSLTLEFEVSRAPTSTRLNGRPGAEPGLALALDGEIGDSFEPGDTGLTFQLAMADVAALLPVEAAFGLRGALDVNGELLVEKALLRVTDLDVGLGSARFTGAVSTPLDAPFTNASVDLDLFVPAPSELLPELGEQLGLHAAVPPLAAKGSVDWLGDGFAMEDLEVGLGRAQVKIAGALRLPVAEGEQTLTVNAMLPSLGELQFASPRPLPDESLTMMGTVTGTAHELQVNISQLDLGASSLTAEAVAVLPEVEGGKPYLQLALRSPVLDLRPYEGLFSAAPEPEQVEPAVSADDGRVIPDLELPLDVL